MASTSANKAFVGFSIGSQKYEFLGKKTIYDGLKSACGLDHVQESHEEGYVTTPINDLVYNAKAIVLTVQGREGKKIKVGKVLVPIDKASTAADNLVGKDYGGWKIQKAYQSGDRSISY